MNTSRENGRATDTMSNATSSATSGLVNSMDQMVRWPLQMTGATWDLMMQGMRNMTGTGAGNGGTGQRSFTAVDQSGSANTTNSSSSSTGDQDLSGDDLKFVVWSIVFTKPGFECVLEPQHSELVNYSGDGASFAAVKIAKFLENARHGRVEKSELWVEGGYPPESAKGSERRTDVITTSGTETAVSSTTSGTKTSAASRDRGWRIPAEDQKYITFLFRVDWRLPKQDPEVTRVERVTVERGSASRIL